MNQDIKSENLMFLAGLNQDIYADNGQFEGLSSGIAEHLEKFDYKLNQEDLIFSFMKGEEVKTLVLTPENKLYDFVFVPQEKKVNLESVSKVDIIKVDPVFEQQKQSFGTSEISFSVMSQLKILFSNHDVIDINATQYRGNHELNTLSEALMKRI
ncbi:hypothetical protein [Macrococcus animalis]|uniref:hypothetical protein n=1 Tax=Macrococcus animalis TaxID=3395467 RepID=UPI0039BDF3FE